MSAVARQTTAGIGAAVGRRWQAADALLPVPAEPPQAAASAGCGADLAVTGVDGQAVATGTCEHWAGAPGSLDLSWGAARRFELRPLVAGPDVGGALDLLLAQWREHLAEVPGAGDQDTAAVVSWPSRDIAGIQTLYRHGLAPLAVVAARGTGRHRPADGAGCPGVLIRRAGPADLDEVVRLGLEVVRYDAHFGSVNERPETDGALRREASEALAGPEPWTWLAERDGAAIGLLHAERPEAAGWIASMTGPGPVAYVTLMAVLPGERGSGVGAALAAELHRDVEAAGVAVTLLHFEQLNPLSAPFWSRQGYRPLWTTWEASPARAIR